MVKAKEYVIYKNLRVLFFIMKVKIKIEGKINDTYTFQQPEDGNILDELAAIIEEMKAGRIEKVEIEREA